MARLGSLLVAVLAVAVAWSASLRATPVFTVGKAVNCGDSTYSFQPRNVTLIPDPPVQGAPAYLNATGVINSVVTGGTATLTVLLDTVQVYTAPANTCGNSTISLPLGFGTINVFGLPCPTTVKQITGVVMGLTLPTGIPSGDFVVQLAGTDQSNANVFCMNAQFSE